MKKMILVSLMLLGANSAFAQEERCNEIQTTRQRIQCEMIMESMISYGNAVETTVFPDLTRKQLLWISFSNNHAGMELRSEIYYTEELTKRKGGLGFLVRKNRLVIDMGSSFRMSLTEFAEEGKKLVELTKNASAECPVYLGFNRQTAKIVDINQTCNLK